MPRPRISTAVAVKPSVRRSEWMAWRRSRTRASIFLKSNEGPSSLAASAGGNQRAAGNAQRKAVVLLADSYQTWPVRKILVSSDLFLFFTVGIETIRLTRRVVSHRL